MATETAAFSGNRGVVDGTDSSGEKEIQASAGNKDSHKPRQRPSKMNTRRRLGANTLTEIDEAIVGKEVAHDGADVIREKEMQVSTANKASLSNKQMSVKMDMSYVLAWDPNRNKKDAPAKEDINKDPSNTRAWQADKADKEVTKKIGGVGVTEEVDNDGAS